MISFLTRRPIQLPELIASVSGPDQGGVASFVGLVRNHQDGRSVERLDYSAYDPMAEAEAGRIVAEAELRWPVRIALLHRLGELTIGDVAVAVVAAGAHRGESFEACRYVIEEVKRRVPIWKKEYYGDGRVEWVGVAESPVDRLLRPLRSLRISVTDRCNMRCRYCMPEDEYVWLPRASILSFEELARVAGIFAGLGVTKLRLTGGEPLLRHDLPSLVRMLAGQAGITDLALTTNGILLGDQAASLRAAGLSRLTVSLDTLRPERMQQFARSNRHGDVIAGIRAAGAAGFRGIKVNAVIIRGYNDDELSELIEFGRVEGLEIRFIEYMDVGGANQWSAGEVVSRREMLDRLVRRHGQIEPLAENAGSSAPADRFRLADGTVFGIIASTTEPFCRTCDRARLTADGHFLLCLYAESGLDLRGPLRDGASDAEISALVRASWEARTDRGAEERAGASDRGALYQLAALRSDPLKEMHTRGG